MKPGTRVTIVNAAGRQTATVVRLRLMNRVEVETADGQRFIVNRNKLREQA
jgi:predicted thioesterase